MTSKVIECHITSFLRTNLLKKNLKNVKNYKDTNLFKKNLKNVKNYKDTKVIQGQWRAQDLF